MSFVATHESDCGTFRAFSDVRSSVAFGGKADVVERGRIDANDANRTLTALSLNALPGGIPMLSYSLDLQFGPDRPACFGRSGGFAPVSFPLFPGVRLAGIIHGFSSVTG